MIQFDKNIFQGGWNHQLVYEDTETFLWNLVFMCFGMNLEQWLSLIYEVGYYNGYQYQLLAVF